MRNLLALVAAAALTVGGVGWYLGWFKVQSNPLPSGNTNLTIEIDREKIGGDLYKGGEHFLRKADAKGQEGSDKGTKDDTSKRTESGKGTDEKPAPKQ